MAEEQTGHKYFEFVFDNDHWRCELRDRGTLGFEAQIYKNDKVVSVRLLESRTLAEGWALMERAMIEHG